MPLDRSFVKGPAGFEKLAPVLPLFTAKDEADALALCAQILEQEGIGHTAIIHTMDESRARRFAERMPASRILVRSGGSLGCIGVGNGLAISFTLGCGTDGGSSTTENVTYTHLRNVKRLAFPTA